ncbi:MAG: hypothetical protein Q9222_000642 [Ikaeria aurantiellina]
MDMDTDAVTGLSVRPELVELLVVKDVEEPMIEIVEELVDVGETVIVLLLVTSDELSELVRVPVVLTVLVKTVVLSSSELVRLLLSPVPIGPSDEEEVLDGASVVVVPAVGPLVLPVLTGPKEVVELANGGEELGETPLKLPLTEPDGPVPVPVERGPVPPVEIEPVVLVGLTLVLEKPLEELGVGMVKEKIYEDEFTVLVPVAPTEVLEFKAVELADIVPTVPVGPVTVEFGKP